MRWLRTSRTEMRTTLPRRRLTLEPLEARICPAPYLLVNDGGVGDGGVPSQVLRYSGVDGSFVDQHSASSDLLQPDLGMTIDPTGTDYLIDGYGSHNVLRYNLLTGAADPAPGFGGATFVSAGSGGLTGTEGIAFGADGNLYVSSDSTHNVLLYDGSTGISIGTFVSAGSGGLSVANALHFGPDGHLYVDNFDASGAGLGKILRFDENTGAPLPADGRTDANFIDPQSGGLNIANGFDWGPDGNLYVASEDPTQTMGSILEYDGTTGESIGTFATGLGFVDGIAWGPDGNLYVTNNVATNPGFLAKITEFDPTGALIGDFVTANSGGLGFAGGLLFYDDGTAPHPGPTHHTHSDSLPVSASLTVASRSAIAGAVEAGVLDTPPASFQAPASNRPAMTTSPSDNATRLAAPVSNEAAGHTAVANLADPLGQNSIDPLGGL